MVNEKIVARQTFYRVLQICFVIRITLDLVIKLYGMFKKGFYTTPNGCFGGKLRLTQKETIRIESTSRHETRNDFYSSSSTESKVRRCTHDFCDLIVVNSFFFHDNWLDLSRSVMFGNRREMGYLLVYSFTEGRKSLIKFIYSARQEQRGRSGSILNFFSC